MKKMSHFKKITCKNMHYNGNIYTKETLKSDFGIFYQTEKKGI